MYTFNTVPTFRLGCEGAFDSRLTSDSRWCCAAAWRTGTWPCVRRGGMRCSSPSGGWPPCWSACSGRRGWWSSSPRRTRRGSTGRLTNQKQTLRSCTWIVALETRSETIGFLIKQERRSDALKVQVHLWMLSTVPGVVEEHLQRNGSPCSVIIPIQRWVFKSSSSQWKDSPLCF